MGRCWYWCFALAAAFVSSPAAAKCTDDQAEALGYIRSTIEAWELEQQTALDPDLAAALRRNTCTWATDLRMQSEHQKATVQRALRRYLTGIAAGEPVPHIGKMIQMERGDHAGVRPQARSLGIVEIKFTRPVDTLVLRGARMQARPRLLVGVGDLRFFGEYNGVRVCSGSARVQLGSKARARC